MGGAGTKLCQLCDAVENTMHLLFECEVYSARIWKTLENCIRGVQNRDPQAPRTTLHAYHILYSNDISGLDAGQNAQLLYLIQEMKRAIIYKRFLRATDGGGGGAVRVYTESRISAHLLLTIKKCIFQKTIAGSTSAYLFDLQQYLIEAL